MGKLRVKWEDELAKASVEAFSSHSIVSRSTSPSRSGDLGRWVMRDAKRSSFYWVEVAELYGGTLIVHGDIQFVVFRMYDVTGNPGRYLRWMNRPSPSDHYMREKAHDSRFDQCRVYTPSIAAEDALDWLSEQSEEDLKHHELRWKRMHLRPPVHTFKESFQEACRRVAADELRYQQAGDVWSSMFDDSETWGGWGWVTSPQFAYVWAALRRLCALLDEEESATLAAPESATTLPSEG